MGARSSRGDEATASEQVGDSCVASTQAKTHSHSPYTAQQRKRCSTMHSGKMERRHSSVSRSVAPQARPNIKKKRGENERTVDGVVLLAACFLVQSATSERGAKREKGDIKRRREVRLRMRERLSGGFTSERTYRLHLSSAGLRPAKDTRRAAALPDMHCVRVLCEGDAQILYAHNVSQFRCCRHRHHQT